MVARQLLRTSQGLVCPLLIPPVCVYTTSSLASKPGRKG